MENENSAVKVDKVDTETRKKEFLSAISSPDCLGIISKAVSVTNICRATVYKWRNSDINFATELVEAQRIGREAFDDEVEDAVYDLIRERDKTTVVFYAKTRLKNRGFSDTQEIKIDNQGESIGISVKTSQHRGND